MYPFLLFFHSIGRWLVLATLLYAIARAGRGLLNKSVFTKSDNMARHWAEVAAQMQLMLGFVLYFVSPLIQYFFANFREASAHSEALFFGIGHISCMLVSVFILTFGSAAVKRKTTDREKFATMLLWFVIALLVICIAIPWPFSPFAHRPYLRAL
jgi:cell division protein FtsW (lipid II flippase)